MDLESRANCHPRGLAVLLALLLAAPVAAADASGTDVSGPAEAQLIIEAPAVASETSLTIEAPALGNALVIEEAPAQRFEVKLGESWRDALTRWSVDAGYTLIWRAPTDILAEAPLVFDRGTSFEGALEEVLRTLWHGRNGLVGSLYRNRVLVIAGRDA